MRCLVVLVMVVGCASSKAPTREVQLAPSASRVEIVNRMQLLEHAYRSLGPVDSWSCRNNLWGSSSIDGAMNQLRYSTARRSGNAISDVRCLRQTTTTRPNCVDYIACEGTALEITSAN